MTKSSEARVADTRPRRRKAEEASKTCKEEIAIAEPKVPKQAKVVPSIIKGVSVPHKPRVGTAFQAELPPLPGQKK